MFLAMQAALDSSIPATAPPRDRHEALEGELINLFTRLVQIVGLPRSLAEIYAVLFASPEPMCMEDVITRTRLSQGGVSQGLRQLRAFGALQTVYVPGDRRTFFAIEDNLRKVAAGFLKEQVLPQIEDWPARMQRIRELASSASGQASASTQRIEKLGRWHRRLEQATPDLLKLIGQWT